MLVPDINQVIKNSHLKSDNEFFKNSYPKFYEYLKNNFPDDITFVERLYWYYHNITSHPVCKVCGKPVKFNNFIKGYRVYCSAGCASKDNDVKGKKIETCKMHYGVDNPSQNSSIIKKKEHTFLKKYGVTHNSKTPEYKAMYKETCMERYGVENPMQNDAIKQKQKNTCKKKYGTTSPMQNNTVKKSQKETCIRRVESLIEFNPSIEVFVTNILDKYNINYELHNRTVLNNYELDVYIPEKMIAIECNGVYWHSDKNKPNNYHYNKYIRCKENGIQLISIWEDQIIQYPDKIESIIKSKLGIYETRIYARKCNIKEVSIDDSKEFINKYHLQNYVNSSVRLGLYYDGELISIMTFGKSRKIFDKNIVGYELYRYCCKSDMQVVGGASKLFKYFINKYNPGVIISFSSNDISNGKLYERLGFRNDKKSTISYWYVDRKYNRYHRYNFRKDILVKRGYDSNKSEFQIMNELGFYRIYDSGQTKWMLNIKNN